MFIIYNKTAATSTQSFKGWQTFYFSCIFHTLHMRLKDHAFAMAVPNEVQFFQSVTALAMLTVVVGSFIIFQGIIFIQAIKPSFAEFWRYKCS